MRVLHFLIFLVVPLILASCSNEEADPQDIGYTVYNCFPEKAGGKIKDPVGPYGLHFDFYDEKGSPIFGKDKGLVKSYGWSSGVHYDFDETKITIVYGFSKERVDYLLEQTKPLTHLEVFNLNGFTVYKGTEGNVTRLYAFYNDIFFIHTGWPTIWEEDNFHDAVLKGFDFNTLVEIIESKRYVSIIEGN